MIRASRQDYFLQLREQFPFFVFEKQEFSLTSRGLDIVFTFNLADQYAFHPRLFVPRKSFFRPDEQINDHLDNIVFNIGMIELISYWKATCSPKLIIRPFSLHTDQLTWWKNLYYHGLGEFFYLNSIDANEHDFMDIVVETPHGASLSIDSSVNHVETPHGASLPNNAIIIPVGGGKDSAVTLELLGNRAGCIPMIMNPRGASLKTIAAKGFSLDQFIEIQRTIDPELLRLNDKGFLNGHTPFSAMLAFVCVLSAILTGNRHVALSNESSANEPTIEGTTINHQYSKSFQFESDFRNYIKRWVCVDVNYFSFLRPLNELQIASLFSRFSRYHTVFKSCNAGSKTDTWCGKCAKCLFTCIILSPFLKEDILVNIFGKNLFADESLVPVFDQLTGVADEKPFECVGTIKEVNIALCETIRQYDNMGMPYLLDYYKNTRSYDLYGKLDFNTEMVNVSTDHFLLPEFLEVLEGWFG